MNPKYYYYEDDLNLEIKYSPTKLDSDKHPSLKFIGDSNSDNPMLTASVLMTGKRKGYTLVKYKEN